MPVINVAFRNVIITNITTLTSVTAPTPSRSASANLTTSAVRVYAGGRRKIITTPDDDVSYPLILNWVTDTDTNTLLSWRGQVLLLRDALGRRVFGTILKIDQTDVAQGTEFFHDLTIIFIQVDYVEGV